MAERAEVLERTIYGERADANEKTEVVTEGVGRP
jgi:hypothetical protein